MVEVGELKLIKIRYNLEKRTSWVEALKALTDVSKHLVSCHSHL